MLTKGWLAAAVAGAIGLAAVLALTGWRAEHFRDGDFIQYWLAGRALLQGVDPYDPVAWRAFHDAIGSRGYEIAPGLGLLYPLPVGLCALPIAVLPLAFAAPLWFVAEGLATAVVLFALGRRLLTQAPRRDLRLLFGLALVMEPSYVIGNDGNIARFLPAIAGGALALLLRDRPFAAGAVLALAGVKPQLFLLYVPVLIVVCPAARRRRFVAGLVAVGLAATAITLAFRPGWIGEWIGQALRAYGGYGTLNVWALLGSGPLALIVVGTVLASAAWWWRAARPSLAQAATVALGLSLALGPYGSDYDLAVLLAGVPVVLATIAPFPIGWRLAGIGLLLVTSPMLQVVAAARPIDHALLLVPGFALAGLVIGTQLLACRLSRDDQPGAPFDPGLPGGSRAGHR